jgi:hypothetical protein
MATASQTATYKGRTYKLLFIGDTKFGRRAKLGFWDGSKEFWVPAENVTVGGAAPAGGSGRPAGGGRTCAECGRPGKLVADLEDGLLKHYGCCDIPPGGY